ncbi:MAG: prenyltransferase, partial [Candidatus Eremiobacteraeota bacterium]|nr:prenyltransferase [Candidatus Eremiobacteraeota bacterium]
MAQISAFIKLSRLKFLTGGFLGVALGAIMAHRTTGAYLWPPIFAAQTVVTALQLMTHYSNDYFDQAADVLAIRTPFSGGSGVFARKELAPAVGLLAAQSCLLIGLLVLSLFAARNNWIVVGLGVLIATLAWSYSSPPMRLHSRGLGECTTALIVGTLVPLLSFAAASNSLSIVACLSTLPAACAMFI